MGLQSYIFKKNRKHRMMLRCTDNMKISPFSVNWHWLNEIVRSYSYLITKGIHGDHVLFRITKKNNISIRING